jgi:outer membrane protein
MLRIFIALYNRLMLSIIVSTFCLALITVHVAAQQPAPILSSTSSEVERIGVDIVEPHSLSLHEAIEMALINNKDIEVAKQDVRSAELNLTGAHGVYDPRFSSSSYYERAETPTANSLGGGENGLLNQSGFTGSLRLDGLAPKFGGNYSLDLSSSRIRTNNQFSALDPQYPTSLTLSFTQPLARGRKFDSNRHLIEIAKKNLQLSDVQFRQRAMETIASVERAYWDLVFSLRNLRIQREAVRDALEQLEHNKRRVKEGTLAPIDTVAAEAQVSEFEQDVYAAMEEVGRNENALKSLIAKDRKSPFWNVSLVPTDDVDLKPPTVSLPDAVKSALNNRPDLQQLNVTREINEIDQRLYREQIKPQVNLTATYGIVGLSGSLVDRRSTDPFSTSIEQSITRVNLLSQQSNLAPLPPPSPNYPDRLIGGYGQSVSNLFANRFNNFRVGVTINIPLRNRTAKAQLGQSLVESDRIKTRREQLEQNIEVDVRNALQSMRTAEARLRSASSLRSASEQQLSSEQRRFDAGQSTFFFVLERQTSLTRARGNELRAQTNLNKAIADLQFAMGNSLQVNGIAIKSGVESSGNQQSIYASRLSNNGNSQ